MSTQKGMTTITRKFFMALSGFFLLVFLLQHCSINFLSVVNPDAFNSVSHFMGTNPLIQFVLQPILAFGVIFHIGMGIYLNRLNDAARPVKYAMNRPSENASWMSRNMVITGIMIMLFLGLHFYDFWIPELNIKFVQGDMSGLLEGGGFRYYEELSHKFHDPIRTGLYVLSFIFLSLHLLHGFQSAFQSAGFRHSRYTPVIKKLGDIYAILVPTGFIVIAVYHFINA